MIVCKCCGQNAPLLGHVDFNKTCEDHKGRRIFPEPGPALPFHRCGNCGFVFTPYCDGWSNEEFAARIYNDEYRRADPDFVTGGRAGHVNLLASLLQPSRVGLRVLDYGSGGNPGHIGARLSALGFDVSSYDPFYSAAGRPKGKFDVIVSIEVIEHCHRPVDVLRDMGEFLAKTGLIYLSTLLHPGMAGPEVLESWYIAPRNGHISIFTLPALWIACRTAGLNLVQLPQGLFAFKGLPSFPTQLFV